MGQAALDGSLLFLHSNMHKWDMRLPEKFSLHYQRRWMKMLPGGQEPFEGLCLFLAFLPKLCIVCQAFAGLHHHACSRRSYMGKSCHCVWQRQSKNAQQARSTAQLQIESNPNKPADVRCSRPCIHTSKFTGQDQRSASCIDPVKQTCLATVSKHLHNVCACHHDTWSIELQVG